MRFGKPFIWAAIFAVAVTSMIILRALEAERTPRENISSKPTTEEQRALPSSELSDVGLSADESPSPSRVEVQATPPVANPLRGEVGASDRMGETLSGRIVNVDGLPAGGLRVCFRRDRRPSTSTVSEYVQCAISDRGGTFTIERPKETGYLEAHPNSPYLTVMSARIEPAVESAVVVVAWGVSLGGLVITEELNPVANAEVRLEFPDEAFTQLGRSFSNGRLSRHLVSTDPHGAFSFVGGVPAVNEARIAVSAPGYDLWTTKLPTEGTESLRVVLTGKGQHRGSIYGQVVTPLDEPASGARISASGLATSADEMGFFALSLAHPSYTSMGADQPLTLIAVKEGYLPAEATLPSLSHGQRAGWPHHLKLRLGSGAMSIRGRVVDQNDSPVPGVRVDIANATAFGQVETSPGSGSFVVGTVEQFLSPGGSTSTTDQEGRFSVDGLLDRGYRLEAMQQETLCAMRTDEVLAGAEDVEIILVCIVRAISGVVVDSNRTPLAGVRVIAARTGGTDVSPVMVFGDHSVTGGDGRFELDAVAKAAEVFLRIEGDAIVPILHLPIERLDKSGEILVERRAYFQIEWDAEWSQTAREARLVSASGTCPVFLLTAESVMPMEKMLVQTGKSPVLVTSANAEQLVLIDVNGEEVGRHEIRLSADQTTQLKP